MGRAGSDLCVAQPGAGAGEEDGHVGVVGGDGERLGQERGGGGEQLAVVLVVLLEAVGERAAGVFEDGDEVGGGEGGDVVLVEEVVERLRVLGDDVLEGEGLGGHGGGLLGGGGGGGRRLP